MTAPDRPRPDLSSFTHVRDPRLRRFLGHYLDLRGDGRVPSRSRLSPLDIPEVLGFVFLYDFDPETGDFTMRLAGQHVASMLLTARAGTPLSRVFPPDVYPSVRERYLRACTEPSVMHNIGRVFHHMGGGGIGERLAMPLLGEDGRPRFLIGATVYQVDAVAAVPPAGEPPAIVTFTPL